MNLTPMDHDQPDFESSPQKTMASIEELFGALQGQVIYHEDINTPTLEEWAEA